MRLVSLDLQNICGFRRAFFTFDPQLNMLFAPNGAGKSNTLNIIRILCSPNQFMGRDFSLYFRRMILHEDYDPTYTSFSWDGFVGTMRAIGTFDVNGESKEVVLEVDPQIAKKLEQAAQNSSRVEEYVELSSKIGIIKNELPSSQLSHCFYADADNPSNMAKFQLNSEAADKFLDIAEGVFGYECGLEKTVKEYDKDEMKYAIYFTDFVMIKRDDGLPIRVHYRRMSEGERKIATLIKQMVTPSQYNNFDIFMIDDIDRHVYVRRHAKMVDKIREHFANKQIIATTHSAVLIGCDNIPAYLLEKNLIDVIKIRKSASR